MSELEDLIKEQAEEMKYRRTRVIRQGEPWMRAVVSLNKVTGSEQDDLSNLLDNQGNMRFRDNMGGWRSGSATGECLNGHSRARMALDALSRPFCRDCGLEAMKRYNASEKGQKRRIAYESKPEVKARKARQKRERLARLTPEEREVFNARRREQGRKDDAKRREQKRIKGAGLPWNRITPGSLPLEHL